MQKILKIIDFVSEQTGEKVTKWLCFVLIIVVVNEVVRRYVFNSPTMWGYETSMMIGGTIYIMGWSYVHRYNKHIRVDILYARASPRIKALIDVTGNLLLFFPLIIVLIHTSFSWALRAWLENEKSIETIWYPPIAPFRTVVVIGLILFAFQGIAQFARNLHQLIRNNPYD